jgi:hypothetical protein
VPYPSASSLYVLNCFLSKGNILLLHRLFLAALILTTSAAQAQVYDATADFSEAGNQNVNGVWSYRQGVNSTILLGSNELYTGVIRWQGSYNSSFGYFPYISKNVSGGTLPINWTTNLLNMHPASDGTESVLRWTAPTTGYWRISGYFQNTQNATSDVRVLHNNTVIFSDYVNGGSSQLTFDSDIGVTAGDIIEFAVGYGGNGWASDGVGLSATIAESTASVTISGRVLLQAAATQAHSVTFEFRPMDGSGTFSRTMTLNADGTYSLSNIPRKNYTVWIKGTKWLAKTVAVNATNGNVSNVDASLFVGDANIDNFVDVRDLLRLIAAYNKFSSADGYSEAADLDGNGANDITDLLFLIANYNKQGDL